MNERIKELAEQAFFDEATSQPSDKMYTFSDYKMQKFAELIVRECVNVADDPDVDILRIGKAIKSHFGVE